MLSVLLLSISIGIQVDWIISNFSFAIRDPPPCPSHKGRGVVCISPGWVGALKLFLKRPLLSIPLPLWEGL
jgi:hypothetical protein